MLEVTELDSNRGRRKRIIFRLLILLPFVDHCAIFIFFENFEICQMFIERKNHLYEISLNLLELDSKRSCV